MRRTYWNRTQARRPYDASRDTVIAETQSGTLRARLMETPSGAKLDLREWYNGYPSKTGVRITTAQAEQIAVFVLSKRRASTEAAMVADAVLAQPETEALLEEAAQADGPDVGDQNGHDIPDPAPLLGLEPPIVKHDGYTVQTFEPDDIMRMSAQAAATRKPAPQAPSTQAPKSLSDWAALL
jgi:hypothetical protein